MTTFDLKKIYFDRKKKRSTTFWMLRVKNVLISGRPFWRCWRDQVIELHPVVSRFCLVAVSLRRRRARADVVCVFFCAVCVILWCRFCFWIHGPFCVSVRVVPVVYLLKIGLPFCVMRSCFYSAGFLFRVCWIEAKNLVAWEERKWRKPCYWIWMEDEAVCFGLMLARTWTVFRQRYRNNNEKQKRNKKTNIMKIK